MGRLNPPSPQKSVPVYTDNVLAVKQLEKDSVVAAAATAVATEL